VASVRIGNVIAHSIVIRARLHYSSPGAMAPAWLLAAGSGACAIRTSSRLPRRCTAFGVPEDLRRSRRTGIDASFFRSLRTRAPRRNLRPKTRSDAYLPREGIMAHVNPIQVQKYLKGVDYPASKAALLERARSLGADEGVQATLEQLPDEEFQTPADVSEAFGKLPVEDEGHGAKGQEARREAKRDHKQEPRQEAQRDQKQDRGHEVQQPRYTGSNEFLIEAMQDTMAEIRICELALEKSSNHDVKVFAQKMIDEHGRMDRDMHQLATQKKLNVPQKIRPEQQMTVDELSSLEGHNFEQRWIQYNIDVHERDIKVFSHYAGEEPDADIRKIAEHGAKMLRQHLKMAHDVGKKLAKA
jgi:predicted outer membrane protein